MVLLIVAVCWCRGNRYKPPEWIFFWIMHQNRVQNTIKCHDNNIWKQMCIKTYLIVQIPIFDTTYKGKQKVEIYIWASHHELVLLLQSKNCFSMYQRMISKETSWAGQRHISNHVYRTTHSRLCNRKQWMSTIVLI